MKDKFIKYLSVYFKFIPFVTVLSIFLRFLPGALFSVQQMLFQGVFVGKFYLIPVAFLIFAFFYLAGKSIKEKQWFMVAIAILYCMFDITRIIPAIVWDDPAFYTVPYIIMIIGNLASIIISGIYLWLCFKKNK